MKKLFKALSVLAFAGTVFAAAPASAEFINGELVRIIVHPDGTVVY